MSWTDERIEERFDGVDRRLDEAAKETSRRFDEAAVQTNRRFDEVAEQTNRQFDEAEKRTNHQFNEVHRRLDGVEGQLAELRGGMAALHETLARGSFGVIASLAGVIVAILIKGG